MSKIIQSKEGFIWLDVTEDANKIFFCNLFNLFLVWEKDGNTFRVPIEDEIDLDYAIEIGGRICIEIGNSSGSDKIEFVTRDSWNSADKITHNGYVYVRYNDLSFCK